MASRGENATQSSSDGDPVETNGASSLYMPWQALSVLASETGQAVRQTFTESGVSTSGHVEQGPKYHTSAMPVQDTDQLNEPQLQEALLDSSQVQWNVEEPPTSVSDTREIFKAEIGRVQRKLLSTDAATEVTLRFNFMGGRESKVRSFCYFRLRYALQCLPDLLLEDCLLDAGCIAVSSGIYSHGSCSADN